MVSVSGKALAEEAEPTQDNGLPETYMLPFLNLTSISIGPVETVQYNTVASITNLPPLYYVNVWVVADEEFRSRTYETTWFQRVSWRDYVFRQVDRAFVQLRLTFGIFPRELVIGTWESDNSLNMGAQLIYDAVAKTGFKAHKTSLMVDGKSITMDILIAWTGQTLTDVVAITDPKLKVILMTYNVYWADDNVLIHEISHIFGAHDHENRSDPHYWDDCIMSNRMVYVAFIIEDWWIWFVDREVCVAALSYNWCSECERNIINGMIYFYPSYCGGKMQYPFEEVRT